MAKENSKSQDFIHRPSIPNCFYLFVFLTFAFTLVISINIYEFIQDHSLVTVSIKSTQELIVDDYDCSDSGNLSPLFTVPRTADFRGPFQLWNNIYRNADLVDTPEKILRHQNRTIILLFHDRPSEKPLLQWKLFEKCPVSHCAVTGYTPFHSKSAAVIFLAINSPLRTTSEPELIRSFREQIFIYWNGESPAQGLGHGWILQPGFFNWTMTYRLDSDIRAHYTYAVKLETKRRNFAAGKKLISWFVSHCPTSSRREEYVEELKKHFQVDVFGKCGNYNKSACPKNATSSCQTDTMRKYKFYIAFENSLCGDYITEKMTNALEAETVPIVMGKGNYKIFPDRSYIHVNDFDSPTTLATYLLELDKNDTEYNRYMEWRYDPERIKSHGEFSAKNSGFCQLCKKLRNSNLDHEHPKIYDNIAKWRSDFKGSCTRGSRITKMQPGLGTLPKTP